jgi:hypothetical protein
VAALDFNPFQHNLLASGINKSRVVDPDPDSMTLGIQIRIDNPDPRARK